MKEETSNNPIPANDGNVPVSGSQKRELKKWWVTWTVNGQKKGTEMWDYSKEEAESTILPKHKPKAIPHEDKWK